MKSMTGFGRHLATSKSVTLDISVKAVNGRYLDIKVNSPRAYNEMESGIKKTVAEFFERGTVDIYIHRQTEGQNEKVIFNEALGKQWLVGFQKMAKKLKIPGEISPEALLSVPDIYRVDESHAMEASEKTLLKNVLKKSLQACLLEKEREGKALKKDMESHLKALKKLHGEITKLRRSSEKEFKLKYQQRLTRIQESMDIDESRMIQEVTLLVEKSDISEELQRLKTHLEEVEVLLKAQGRVGKKLDFFAQELLREVNTMGSKSATAAITKKVVDGKATIEKFREQVQNIE